VPGQPVQDEFFGWTTFGRKPVEAPVARKPEPRFTAFGFTSFGEAEPGAVEPEAPEVTLAPTRPQQPTPEAPARPKPTGPLTPPAAAPKPTPEAPARPKQTAPLVPPAARRPEAAPRPTPVLTPELKAIMERVQAEPENVGARLYLARQMWQAQMREDALRHYAQLIRANAALDDVLKDLETYLQEAPQDVQTLRTLGDAYLRVGRLDVAESLYKRAINLI